MDHDHGHGPGGDMSSMAPQAPPSMSTNHTLHMTTTTMHMAFFWDNKNTEILFSGWPGTNTGMYYLSLLLVCVLAFGVEWVSRCSFINKPGVTSDVVSGMMLTLMHTVRMGLAYLVMLAVMSFNGGVFIAAVAGHCVGFLVFGTRICKKSRRGGVSEVNSELPPMSC